MNDLTGVPKNATCEAVSLRERGHRFRGAFIENCSRIEHWATCVLDRAFADGPAECPRFLRQKLKALAELAETDSKRPRTARILTNPARVLGLLSEFEPYVAIRADLAHSVQKLALAKDGTPIWTFVPAGCREPWRHIALTDATQETLVRRLHSLAKRFEDQRFGQPNPSSPPQPKPASAAGP